MTPAEFKAWQARMGYTNPQCAAALGVCLSTVKSYRAGRAVPSVAVQLAMRQLGDNAAK